LPFRVRHFAGLLHEELATRFAARFMVFGHLAYELLAVLTQRCDVEQVLEAAPSYGSRLYDAVGAQQMHGALEVRQRAAQQKHGDYLEVTGFDNCPVPDARGDKNAFSHTFELGRELFDFFEGAFHQP
jgi:hypothetical protein